jgi:hypothetical protein
VYNEENDTSVTASPKHVARLDQDGRPT